jgi:hypothetical protein
MQKLNWLEHRVDVNIPKKTFNNLFKGCKQTISVMCRTIVKKHYDSLSEQEQRNLLKVYDELTQEQIKKPHH